MKYRGVVYDVGLKFTPERFSVEPFDPDLAQHDINVIAKDVHANAVRIEGEEIHRLVTTSRFAHAAGLAVFFNPWKMNATADELLSYYAEAAKAAEQLRKEGVDIVFVTGCEYTIFNDGVFPGSSVMERIEFLSSLFKADDTGGALAATMQEKSPLLNDKLRSFVDAVRAEFAGPVTYSAGAWESVDWSIFDIVGVDHYRHGEPADKYVGALDPYRLGKPLIVMEVGSCAYEGAGPLGAGGFMRLEGVNPDGTGKFVGDIVPTRSEREQADYVEEQFELLNGAGVDGVFIYVFSFPSYRTGEGAKDLDMMSFSLVKTFPVDDPRSRQMPPWAPKEAFHRIAETYRRQAVSPAFGE